MGIRHRDRLPGGLADKSKPGDFDQDQLRMGISVEMEHTNDRKVAKEIAMDHLKEDPRYYSKLKRVHKEGLDMDLRETINWLSHLKESLEEATPVKATGQTRGYLPGVTPTSKKPPPTRTAARSQAGLKPLPTRNRAPGPPIALKKKGGDDTAQALAGIKKMNRSDTDKALDDIRTLSRGGKLESFNLVASIRRLIEAEGRYGGGPSLNPGERAAKGMPKQNLVRRAPPNAAKGSLKARMQKIAKKVDR